MRIDGNGNSSNSAIEMRPLGDREEQSPITPGSGADSNPTAQERGTGIVMSWPTNEWGACGTCHQDCDHLRCISGTMIVVSFLIAIAIVIYSHAANMSEGSKSFRGSRQIAGISFAVLATVLFFLYVWLVGCGSSQRELGVRRLSGGSGDGSGDSLTHP